MEMTNQPLKDLSVLVTCYNKIDSIVGFLAQAQQLVQFGCELIVVDDGSQDGSRELLGDGLKDLTNCRFIEQTNQGSAAARNSAMAYATRDYLQFLDIDDFLNIELLLDIFRSNCLNPQKLAIFELSRVTGPDFPSYRRNFSPRELRGDESQQLFMGALGYSRIIYPRQIIVDYGIKFVPTFASLGGARFILDDFFWIAHIAALKLNCNKFETDLILYGYVKPEDNSHEIGVDFARQASLFLRATTVFIRELSKCAHVHDLDFLQDFLKTSILFHLRYVLPGKMFENILWLLDSKSSLSLDSSKISKFTFRFNLLRAAIRIFTKTVTRRVVTNFKATRLLWNSLTKVRNANASQDTRSTN